MFAQAVTGSLYGLETELTLAEVDLTPGIPSFTTVGLPDTSIKEAKERIRAAIINSGYHFSAKKITVNLSPADKKKEGTHYDLPIALAILNASCQVKSRREQPIAFLGELSLDGRIRPVRGALPLVIGFRKNGIRSVILPAENAKEAAAVSDIALHPAYTLKEAVDMLTQEQEIPPYEYRQDGHSKIQEGFEDFSDVAGQERGKRALQIAASAQHNLLMLGAPGAGKTMMARRLPGILPSLTYEEQLEVTQIYSIAGELSAERDIIRTRPFRAPHHTITPVALIGGGRNPKPGEVSLAHHGVLFLDELPEFGRYAIEMLRQPIEDEQVMLSRISGSFTYPSKFMLVASMNPCKCGNYGSSGQECVCTPNQIQNYLSKISAPLLDRIDLQLEIFPVPYKELSKESKNKTSAEMRREVEAARKIQLQRYKNENISYNSQLTGAQLTKYCKLNRESKELLEAAFEKMALSARAHSRIIKLARSIADLAGRSDIAVVDIAEAIQYRGLDKKYRRV